MKHLIVVLALLGCKDDKKPAPPPPTIASAAPADAAVLDVCAIGKVALEAAKCEQAETQAALMKAKKSIDGIIDALGQLGGGNPQQFQVACGTLLLAIERDATKSKCVLALEPARREEIVKMLEAWYAQRTPVVPTGDAASDAVIAKIAAMRDAACACNDAACLDRVDKTLPSIGTLPEKAPQAARDLGSKLIEDASRCATRVRTLTDPG